MRLPKDHHSSVTIGKIRTARIFSNIVSPPVIFVVLGLALSLRVLPFVPALLWAAVYGFWVSLLPILLVVYFLRTGQISDLHMNTTRERQIPYIAGVLGTLCALIFTRILDGPRLLESLSVSSLIALTSLGIINYFWKISIHATSVSAAVVITAAVFDIKYGLLLVPLALLVIYVRLYLHRHNVAQVLAGVAIGIGASLPLVLTGWFSP